MTEIPPGQLHWDATEKQVKAKTADTSVTIVFAVTNTSAEEISIHQIRTSCGCTVPRLPSQPWRLAPGTGGELPFDVDLRGRTGLLSKVANVLTSKGCQALVLKVDIPSASISMDALNNRLRNMQIAAADRQAVFRGDCATCHATPAAGKHGEALFSAVCGICHEADHRAAMVPDLQTLTTPADRDYWQWWITHGKANSLMPAFGHLEGGPLSDEQVGSLVDHLLERYKQRPSSLGTKAAPGPPAISAESPAQPLR